MVRCPTSLSGPRRSRPGATPRPVAGTRDPVDPARERYWDGWRVVAQHPAPGEPTAAVRRARRHPPPGTAGYSVPLRVGPTRPARPHIRAIQPPPRTVSRWVGWSPPPTAYPWPAGGGACWPRSSTTFCCPGRDDHRGPGVAADLRGLRGLPRSGDRGCAGRSGRAASDGPEPAHPDSGPGHSHRVERGPGAALPRDVPAVEGAPRWASWPAGYGWCRSTAASTRDR